MRRKRHLIYARDEWKCLWCGCTVDVNENATLDHYLSREHGGTNASCNLFTCCYECNSQRQDLLAEEFAASLEDGESILIRIQAQLLLALPGYREPEPWENMRRTLKF